MYFNAKYDVIPDVSNSKSTLLQASMFFPKYYVWSETQNFERITLPRDQL